MVSEIPPLRRPVSPTPRSLPYAPVPWPVQVSSEFPPQNNLNDATFCEISEACIIQPIPANQINRKNALVTNADDFVCSICEIFITERQGVELKNCSHCFCRTCLKDAIEKNKNQGDVLCPMTIVKCGLPINDEEIQALLTEEAYQMHLDRVYGWNDPVNGSVPELLQLEDSEFVETKMKFECGICLSIIRSGSGITLKNCLHEYCKTCLAKTIEASEDLEVPCPFVAEDGVHCFGTLQDCEMRYLITPEFYTAHLVKSLERAEAAMKNAFHCKTPDGVGWAECDEGATNFHCPVCNKINCIKCKANHEGITCNDYYYEINEGARKHRDDRLTEDQVQAMVRAKEAMPCPGCGVMIQKNAGCNHMKCTRCKRDFQWLGKA